mmetsp:Transcript_29057/g.29397  ORF Transcript_29057/g.29397 Transcript_29057/m.29397 type:complete len:472 (+) Transcript_29057:50-1465(+)
MKLTSLLLLFVIRSAYGADMMKDQITDLSQLPLDENGHLASHWLLLTDKCEGDKFINLWNKHTHHSNLRNFSKMSLKMARMFIEEYSGDECIAVALQRGVPLKYIPYPTPEAIFEDEFDDLEGFVLEECVVVEFGFMSYHPNVLLINWISSKKHRSRVTELDYGEQRTFWTNSRIGHEFEAVDAMTNETVAHFTVLYNAINVIGQPKLHDFDLKNEEKLVREMFNEEVERSKRVSRTFTEFGFSKGRLPDDIYGSILTYYYNNDRVNGSTWEEHDADDVSINWYHTPTDLIALPWALKGYWQDRLYEMVQSWIGEGTVLEDTDLYGIRRYNSGARLLTHVDRTPTHAVSLIVNIDQKHVNTPWKVEIYDHAYRLHEIEMNPGDVVYYESARCLHGRMTPLDGGYYVNLFTHYRPEGDPKWFKRKNPEGTPEPRIDISGIEVKTLSPSNHVVHTDNDLFEYWKRVTPIGTSA